MRMKAIWAAVPLMVCLVPSTGLAAPIYAGYPPPGGATFSASGGALTDASGRTRIYGGFDTSGGSFSELYFDILTGSVTPVPGSGLTFDTRWNSDGGFGWSSQAGITNEETIGLGTITWPTGTGSASTGVNLILDFYQADGTTPINGHFLVSTIGDGLPALVFDMSPADLIAWGGGFQVEQRYQTSGGLPLGPYYNSTDPAGSGFKLNSATNGAFWYDPPTSSDVPEPGSLFLLGGGFFVAARKLRRSKS